MWLITKPFYYTLHLSSNERIYWELLYLKVFIIFNILRFWGYIVTISVLNCEKTRQFEGSFATSYTISNGEAYVIYKQCLPRIRSFTRRFCSLIMYCLSLYSYLKCAPETFHIIIIFRDLVKSSLRPALTIVNMTSYYVSHWINHLHNLFW